MQLTTILVLLLGAVGAIYGNTTATAAGTTTAITAPEAGSVSTQTAGYDDGTPWPPK